MSKRNFISGLAIFILLSLSQFSHAEFIGYGQITPSTNLPTLDGFSIDQIADGITSDDSPYNGFATPYASSGLITLDLDKSYNLNAFVLWNDINVQVEGISHFRLDFFGANSNFLSVSQTFTAPVGQLAPATFGFDTVFGVNKVNLVVFDSNPDTFNRIEIREVGFIAAVPEPETLVLFGLGLIGISLSRRKFLSQK